MNDCNYLSIKKLSEDRLLEQLRLGNSQAVREWYFRYSPYLSRLVNAKITSSADAEEIVQEVFIACLRELPLFKANSGLKTWMTSIAKHKIADYYRAMYAKKILKCLPLWDHLTDLDKKISLTTELVLLVLKKLSSFQQELLYLKYVDKYSVTELANRFHKSNKSIESQLFRARKDFRLAYLKLSNK